MIILSQNRVKLTEQSYERITYECYTEQEMKEIHSLAVSQHIINVLMGKTMRNVCIPKSELQTKAKWKQSKLIRNRRRNTEEAHH